MWGGFDVVGRVGLAARWTPAFAGVTVVFLCGGVNPKFVIPAQAGIQFSGQVCQ